MTERDLVTWLAILTLAVLAAAPAPLRASESPADAESTHAEEAHHGGHSSHRNMVALFVGVTHEDRRENSPALGLEYERRLGESLGVGALVEHTFGDEDFTVFAIPFARHWRHWKFYLAPGVEDSEQGSEELLRIGLERGFEVGGWEVAPQIDLDLVDDEEVLVFGVAIGKSY